MLCFQTSSAASGKEARVPPKGKTTRIDKLTQEMVEAEFRWCEPGRVKGKTNLDVSHHEFDSAESCRQGQHSSEVDYPRGD